MNRRRLKSCFVGGYEKESVLEYAQALLQGYQWELIRLQRQLEAKDVLLEKEQAKLEELKLQMRRRDILLRELRSENGRLAAQQNRRREELSHSKDGSLRTGEPSIIDVLDLGAEAL